MSWWPMQVDFLAIVLHFESFILIGNTIETMQESNRT